MPLRLILAIILLLAAFGVRADDPWSRPGADGRAEVQLYFFWSTTCPHCTAAHPFVSAIPQQRPWVRVHEMEVSRHPDNVARFEELARLAGGEAEAVPSFVFCGEMQTGWDGEQGSGAGIGNMVVVGATTCLAGRREFVENGVGVNRAALAVQEGQRHRPFAAKELVLGVDGLQAVRHGRERFAGTQQQGTALVDGILQGAQGPFLRH